MAPRRIFRLAYHSSQSSDSRFRIHQLRDCDAFVQLSAALYAKGYEYGGLLLNLPSDGPANSPEVDVSLLSSRDVVVLNTRPPVDDIQAEVKRPVRRSYSRLEDLIFKALRPNCFEWCARSRITLSEAIAGQLNTDFKNKADIQFHSSHDSSYLRYRGYKERLWHKPPPNEKRTAVFLIQLPAIWPDGPALLAAFGMGGTETLIWNYLLRTRFLTWLDSYQFLIAEVLLRELPDQPSDLYFADDWEVTPMVGIPFSETVLPASNNSPR